ncbi:MAG: ABC transporter permease [Vampirovibrionales bacterium]|nr:ABC transporter permease [Vampirovibrionales bacterium]
MHDGFNLKQEWRQGVWPLFVKIIQQETQDWWLEILTTAAVPITYFVAFGLGLRSYIGTIEGVSYLAFLTPGLITLTIVLEAYRTGAWGLWLDKWHTGMIDEYRIKPVGTASILAGNLLGGFTMALIKGCIVAALMIPFAGVTFKLSNLIPYFALVFPGSVMFTALGSAVGVSFRKPDHIANSVVLGITPLLYMSGLFFPLKQLPEGLQPYLRWLPTTALFDGGRQALLTGEIPYAHYLWLVWAFAVAGFYFAVVWFNRKLSD